METKLPTLILFVSFPLCSHKRPGRMAAGKEEIAGFKTRKDQTVDIFKMLVFISATPSPKQTTYWIAESLLKCTQLVNILILSICSSHSSRQAVLHATLKESPIFQGKGFLVFFEGAFY